jgi:hypothetical protein
MSTNERNVQTQFIQKLKETIPSTNSLVDELASLLNLSTDSAYRRIRCETSLTIDEVAKLCSHYRINFDFGGQSGDSTASVTFSYSHLSSDIRNFEEYLGRLTMHMKQIKVSEPKEIIWAAEDVPIFHHFRYPTLMALKLFYWSKSILNAPEMENQKFAPEILPQNLVDKVREIHDLYTAIPSIEIWTEDTLNSTLKQVEFYSDSGHFTSTDQAMQVLDEISQMIASIEKQATHGLKFKGEAPEANSTIPFKLYQSDLMVGNNSILTTAGSSRVTYISLNTFNSMATTSTAFNEEIERWLKNLMRKSNLISGVSEKQRFRFFKMMNDKIARARERILAG